MIIIITQLNSNEALIGSYPKNIIQMGYYENEGGPLKLTAEEGR